MRSINQPDVGFRGPGGRFSDIMKKGKATIPSEKSPIKTPIKQEGSINHNNEYSLFSKFRNVAASTLIDQDATIEERKETSSNSNNGDLNRHTSSRVNSSSSEDTPSVGDEG